MNTASVEASLLEIIDPNFDTNPIAANTVRRILCDAGVCEIDVVLPYPAKLFKSAWQQVLQMHLQNHWPDQTFKVSVTQEIPTTLPENSIPSLSQVKNIVTIASGKGGVGKSTVAANLAMALAREGAQVGLLDADIYGPSQGMLFGAAKNARPVIHEEKMEPLILHGVKLISMSFLTTDKTPMAWRGPMASGALMQLLTQTHWGELDYLLIDMPPGTGDIQLTLTQKTPITGAIVVTTPQALAQLDAERGIEMFLKMQVPVLGVIENMATHICTACSHEDHPFGQGAANLLADQYQVPILSTLPLSLALLTHVDTVPLSAREPNSALAETFQILARRVGVEIAKQNLYQPPVIVVSDD